MIEIFNRKRWNINRHNKASSFIELVFLYCKMLPLSLKSDNKLKLAPRYNIPSVFYNQSIENKEEVK